MHNQPSKVPNMNRLFVVIAIVVIIATPAIGQTFIPNGQSRSRIQTTCSPLVDEVTVSGSIGGGIVIVRGERYEYDNAPTDQLIDRTAYCRGWVYASTSEGLLAARHIDDASTWRVVAEKDVMLLTSEGDTAYAYRRGQGIVRLEAGSISAVVTPPVDDDVSTGLVDHRGTSTVFTLGSRTGKVHVFDASWSTFDVQVQPVRFLVRNLRGDVLASDGRRHTAVVKDGEVRTISSEIEEYSVTQSHLGLGIFTQGLTGDEESLLAGEIWHDKSEGGLVSGRIMLIQNWSTGQLRFVREAQASMTALSISSQSTAPSVMTIGTSVYTLQEFGSVFDIRLRTNPMPMQSMTGSVFTMRSDSAGRRWVLPISISNPSNNTAKSYYIRYISPESRYRDSSETIPCVGGIRASFSSFLLNRDHVVEIYNDTARVVNLNDGSSDCITSPPVIFHRSHSSDGQSVIVAGIPKSYIKRELNQPWDTLDVPIADSRAAIVRGDTIALVGLKAVYDSLYMVRSFDGGQTWITTSQRIQPGYLPVVVASDRGFLVTRTSMLHEPSAVFRWSMSSNSFDTIMPGADSPLLWEQGRVFIAEFRGKLYMTKEDRYLYVYDPRRTSIDTVELYPHPQFPIQMIDNMYVYDDSLRIITQSMAMVFGEGDLVTSIDDVHDIDVVPYGDMFGLRPNPVTGTFQVTLSTNTSDKHVRQLRILNLAGQVVVSYDDVAQRIEPGVATVTCEIPPDMPSGLYYLTYVVGPSKRLLPLLVLR